VGDEAVVRVRPCRREDLTAVRGILEEAPEAAAWSEGALDDSLIWDADYFLVAESEGKVTGFGVGRRAGEEAEILNLAVKPGWRRKGIAGALVRELTDLFAQAGVKKVFLEVRESNRGAREFYEGMGFAEVGRREGYYADKRENAVVMGRELKVGSQ
jgi:ribosomal-protein-alanine acetyltransferase